MNYAEAKVLLEYYVDDVVDTATTSLLLNAGKNKMAVAVHSKFPDIEPVAPNDTFVFDDRFHELPVLYAAAMAKSYDSSIQEKNSYLTQFEINLKDFVQNYDPPIQYVQAEYIYHMTVTESVGTTLVDVMNKTYNTHGNVNAFVNSMPIPHLRTRTGIVLHEPAPFGSVITVTWEPNRYEGAQSWQKAW